MLAKIKSILELVASCFAYFLIVMLIDLVVIWLFLREPAQIFSSLSFIMLIEGGVGLTVGGAVVLYSPAVSKMGEIVFHFRPWTAKRQKAVEKEANAWIVTGIILVFAALLISAL